MGFMKHLKLKSRVVLSVITAGLVAAASHSVTKGSAWILCIWDAGMISFLALTWIVMVRATPDAMRRYANSEDEGRVFILSTITAAACASLLALGFLLKDSKDSADSVLASHLLLAVITIVGSWLLVHTIFALHYAHDYYQSGKTLSECQSQGLNFPNEIEPDYWDFLYFSFVIGMTSQVSDISINSRTMRQLALFHGVLSFFFNTTLVALTINIVAGLL
jgi:uncharacterized membrane protein